MNAPVDIVIRLIQNHLNEVLKVREKEVTGVQRQYFNGKRDAYADLIGELEGFKRLFS